MRGKPEHFMLYPVFSQPRRVFVFAQARNVRRLTFDNFLEGFPDEEELSVMQIFCGSVFWFANGCQSGGTISNSRCASWIRPDAGSRKWSSMGSLLFMEKKGDELT